MSREARHPSTHPGHVPAAGQQPAAEGKDSPCSTAQTPRTAAADDESSKALQEQMGRLQQELSRAQEEMKRLNDQYLRMLADAQNIKKRLDREKEEFVRFASETMVRGLLPIIDSLDQALLAAQRSPDPQALTQGIRLIHRQLLTLLDQAGVKRIQTLGEHFDPHQHEAVAQVETKDAQTENRIVEEVQVGYRMHDKVIRPAMVKVAKKTVTQSVARDQ